MCGAMVGCVVCEGYAFFIKNACLLNWNEKRAKINEKVAGIIKNLENER